MRRKDSEDLVRVGPGTVMGGLMRQYWLPAAMSSELKADGEPVRLLLLGEQLIAFRDSSGRVGVMDHRCPHRCASLFLGRNEENGIRCVYHGWKYDVDGNCVDTPNLAGPPDFKNRIKAKAYQTVERNGLAGKVRGVDAVAVDVVFPAVIDAADAVFLVAPQKQRGAAMRAAVVHDPDPARTVAERDQLLAEQKQANWRAIRLQLRRHRRRQPVFAHQPAHHRAGPDADQILAVLPAHGLIPHDQNAKPRPVPVPAGVR